MSESKNGKKGNIDQWDRNDEVTNCSPPEGAPSSKVTSRPQTFCDNVTINRDLVVKDNVTINGDLVVEGNVTIAGTLKVGGTITAPYFDGIAKSARGIV